MDAFPSAFERFEVEVNVNRFRDYQQLKRAFERWAGYRWIDSMEQNRALRREALERGFPFRGGIELPTPRPIQREKRPYGELHPLRFKNEFDRLGRPHTRDTRTGRFTKRR